MSSLTISALVIFVFAVVAALLVNYTNKADHKAH